MTFLEQLQSHKGGLLRLKTELYWYGGRGYDGNPGRVCLILDTAAARGTTADYATLLLIDGAPHWVWIVEQDVELL